MALDALKQVSRRSYIAKGARLENSAEHSLAFGDGVLEFRVSILSGGGSGALD